VEVSGAQALPPATKTSATIGAAAEDFPEAVVDGLSGFLGKPRARGWIHVYAAAVATIAGAALVWAA